MARIGSSVGGPDRCPDACGGRHHLVCRTLRFERRGLEDEGGPEHRPGAGPHFDRHVVPLIERRRIPRHISERNGGHAMPLFRFWMSPTAPQMNAPQLGGNSTRSHRAFVRRAAHRSRAKTASAVFRASRSSRSRASSPALVSGAGAAGWGSGLG
jgi:hypothetical protein